MAEPPLLYRALRAVVRTLMRVFFRDITVAGRRNVPEAGGGLLVAWHPNGVIDPALILSTFPGQIVFGARHGLLKWPLLGALMRGLGTVPIYRAQDAGTTDPEARRAANEKSLGALADQIAAGSFSALFPEGVSHDDPSLRDVKTGAARLYLRARAEAAASETPPVIVPVGLHYDDKDLFRSDVLVAYHPPLRLGDLPEGDGEETVRALTGRIEAALVEAVRPTEDWQTHRLMHRAYALMRAEDDVRDGVDSGPATFEDRTRGFRMVWHGYQARRDSHPQEIEALRRDVAAYDRLLRTTGLADADLDRPPEVASPLLVALFLVQLAAVAILLPPVIVLGFVVNLPAFWLLNRAARRFAAAEKDTATVKILGGIVLYPLAWTIAAVLAGLGAARLHDLFPALPDAPLLAGVAVFVLSALGGAMALRWGELVKETSRAVRARFFRRRRRDVIARLQLLRTDLHARFSRLAEGLDLPESVV
ncbi:MAG: 1-acyl-sn-glycerol-3-phosphate acyltransferase [Bacteroidota bacterium]